MDQSKILSSGNGLSSDIEYLGLKLKHLQSHQQSLIFDLLVVVGYLQLSLEICR